MKCCRLVGTSVATLVQIVNQINILTEVLFYQYFRFFNKSFNISISSYSFHLQFTHRIYTGYSQASFTGNQAQNLTCIKFMHSGHQICISAAHYALRCLRHAPDTKKAQKKSSALRHLMTPNYCEFFGKI